MNGILNINKPAGMTSFGVVAQVKHLTHEHKVGHAGTLDPQATGVLPLCFGQATRVIEFLFDETKTYRAEIELGIMTDTYDSTGKVIQTADTSGIHQEMVESALTKFRGAIRQAPPMYSAVKYLGRPLYELARSGIEIERKSRTVRIESLRILKWQAPVITLDIVCGKGTYIRSLAHDLGETLGCGGILKKLVRSRVGPFTIEDALTLSRLEKICRQGRLEKYLYTLDHVLTKFDTVKVSTEQQKALFHGAPIVLDSSLVDAPGGLYRAYTEDGRFLGMIKFDAENHQWLPQKIFLRDA